MVASNKTALAQADITAWKAASRKDRTALTQHWMYARLLRPTRKRELSSLPPLEHLVDLATKRLENRYATSTWAHRQSVWSQYQDYLHQWKCINPSTESALAFVEAKLLRQELKSPNSAAVYTRTLISILSRTTTDSDLTQMRDYAKSLEKQAHLPDQATPVSKALLYKLVEDLLQLDEDAALLLYMMWKTLSRYDDVRRLMGRDIHPAPIQSVPAIVVHFRDTKNTQYQPFRVDAYVMIKERTYPHLFNRLQRYLLKAPKEAEIFHATYPRMLKFMEKEGLSLHSVKRGATMEIAQMIADGKLPQAMLSQMARHKVAGSVADTTVRYLSSNPGLIAAMNGSAGATVLI